MAVLEETTSLVSDVLEHATLHVFVAIENDTEWLREYKRLCDQYDPDTVNQMIGKATRALLEAKVIDDDVPVRDKTTLCDTYSTLGV